MVTNEIPEPFRYDCHIKRKDGRHINIEVDWDYRRNEAGDIALLAGAVDRQDRVRKRQAGLEIRACNGSGNELRVQVKTYTIIRNRRGSAIDHDPCR